MAAPRLVTRFNLSQEMAAARSKADALMKGRVSISDLCEALGLRNPQHGVIGPIMRHLGIVPLIHGRFRKRLLKTVSEEDARRILQRYFEMRQREDE